MAQDSFLFPFVFALTNLGSPEVVVAIALLSSLLFFARRRYQDIQFLWVVLIANQILVFALKLAANKPRPPAPLIAPEDPFSFPSGHAAVAVALYGTLLFLFLRGKKNSLGAKAFAVLVVLIIFAIGASRIALGVHYPIDVFAGYAIGLFVVLFSTQIRGKILEGRRQHRQPRGA